MKNYEKTLHVIHGSAKMIFCLTVNANEFPDYVNDCPCTFTKEYMMKKIRKKREALIKEILDSFEQDRLTRQPIEFIDTDEVVINNDFAIPTTCVLIKREE